MTCVYAKKETEQFYENWINEHGHILYNYILSLVRNRDLAEDLYQEVLISAYCHLNTLEKMSNFNGWIYRIAVNKCRDYWRKKKTQQRFWEEKVYFYLNDRKQSSPHPEEIAIRKCERRDMLDYIQSLSPMYSEPLLLFYYENLTLTEISAAKKVPLSTVKTRMRRAKLQLMKIVEQSAPAEGEYAFS